MLLRQLSQRLPAATSCRTILLPATGIVPLQRYHVSSTSTHRIRIARYSTMSSTEPKRFKEDGEVVIGTHDGVFHCDEVLACYMLQQLPKYEGAAVKRTRDQKLLDQCDIVVDVGAVFDPAKNRFDHHQASFQETLNSLRPEVKVKREIRLSSAGLIYTYFGEEVIRRILARNAIHNPDEDLIKGVYRKLYDTLIAELDGIDNGVPMFDGEPKYTINTHLSARVSHFNPAWNETSEDPEDANKRFEKAKAYVGAEFSEKVLYYATRWWPARAIVEKAVRDRLEVHASGEILELENFCPWKEHLYELEGEHEITGLPKYVIYCNRPGDWRVICVPLEPASFVCRKFLSAKWRGERDDKLEEISGIPGANFCHQTGFIGGNKTREGALRMAVVSLEEKEE